MLKLEFELNQAAQSVEVDPDRTLLDVLRRDFDLTGTKKGCDNEGQCGSCTVIVEGRAVRACVTKVSKVAGKQVTTIEGIGSPDALHPLQQAFIDAGAVQCGFSTPGLIMSAKALLDRELNPAKEQILRALTGNLCRCTGYTAIVSAIQQAAAVMRGAADQQASNLIGVSEEDDRRYEAVDRVTGQLRFVGDMHMPGMLYAQALRSPHAHARISNIDDTAALQVAGVVAVYTAQDIPGVNGFGDAWAARNRPETPAREEASEPVLAIDRVRMVGEPVAILVAETEEAVQAGLERMHVEYELLDPVTDSASALLDSAPALHSSGNLYECAEIKQADCAEMFARSAVEVTTSYAAPGRDHVTLEPESMLSYADEDGRLVVIGPTHQPHMRQHMIAQMLSISPDQIRVIGAPMGGSFGGRHHYWPVVAAALPAFLLGRPVHFTYSRAEVFDATLKGYAASLDYRVGADQDGRLTGLQARGLADAGPYGGAPAVAPFIALCGSGPYTWQAIDYEVQVAHTNNGNAGPLRGYAMPHGALALECSLDELAVELDIDPWELRMLNAADNETGACTGQLFDEPFGFKQVLETIKPDWEKAKTAARQQQPSNGSALRGAGLAASWYQYGKAGDLRTQAQARLGTDGRITLLYTAQNAGQGMDTLMSQLGAKEFGISRRQIDIVNGDTDLTLDSHVYGACKSAYWVGGAVITAARVLKHGMLGVTAEMLNVSPDLLIFENGGVAIFDQLDRSVSFADIAHEFMRLGLPLTQTGVFSLEEKFSGDRQYPFLGHFAVGAAVAEVSVQPATGKVKVLRLSVAQDVGKALNELDVRGQLVGSAMMELGAALLEEYIPGASRDFKHYRIPRATDLPEINIHIVEVAGSDGPAGAKGVGEAAVGHVRAAIINAIYAASGVRIRQLPATPARVSLALQQKS